jgi:hypothetical protein
MGSVARFDWPFGVAVDSAGNVYVADSYNSTIRKVTPAGSVTTLAGMAGTSASADGTGSDARFGQPFGLTIDSAGDVYVADSGNNTIRKVTPVGANWVVTTLVGGYGSVDGTGSAVRFGQPFGLAVDSAGDLYVSDDNNTIRKGYLGYPPPRLLTSGPGFGSNAGHFGFNLTGSAGQPVVVEASTDLLNWLPIWTNTFTGTLSFSDPQSGSFSRRFYRTRAP